MNRYLLILCVCLGIGYAAFTQTQSPGSTDTKKESKVSGHASGSFDIKMAPQPVTEEEKKTISVRMTSDKQFHGDLEGTSTGEMLGVFTAVKDSAGYVAMERVTGKLNGRTGTFILQHSSTMERGKQQQSITVIPDSGTDQLAGLAGSMIIKITDGKHLYEFDYTLPEKSK
ncbi:MAG TPA: DUF3224 domain-containing protein [Candidatus Angelobacter sp.]